MLLSHLLSIAQYYDPNGYAPPMMQQQPHVFVQAPQPTMMPHYGPPNTAAAATTTTTYLPYPPPQFLHANNMAHLHPGSKPGSRKSDQRPNTNAMFAPQQQGITPQPPAWPTSAVHHHHHAATSQQTAYMMAAPASTDTTSMTLLQQQAPLPQTFYQTHHMYPHQQPVPTPMYNPNAFFANQSSRNTTPVYNY